MPDWAGWTLSLLNAAVVPVLIAVMARRGQVTDRAATDIAEFRKDLLATLKDERQRVIDLAHENDQLRLDKAACLEQGISLRREVTRLRAKYNDYEYVGDLYG